MKTSNEGRALIEAFEGLYLKTYKDSVGVLTIGYGHTSAAGGPKVIAGQTITEPQADQLLADDLARVEKDVIKFITVPLKQCEFDALVSFHFNTGKLGSGSIAKKINVGKKEEAMQTLLQYDHAGGQVLSGLTRRRKAEKLLFEGKISQALALAGAKKPVTAGPIVATGSIAATIYAALHNPEYWMWFAGGVAVIGLLTWLYYKGKKNV